MSIHLGERTKPKLLTAMKEKNAITILLTTVPRLLGNNVQIQSGNTLVVVTGRHL
jgi:hypothetical protein